MKYEVVTYGDPRLREKSIRVEVVGEDIRRLVRDMLETMYVNNGLGLAAEQVGHRESVCVLDVPAAQEEACGFDPKANAHVTMPLILINPRIDESEGTQAGQEGCLSFPEIYAHVTRAASVTVTYMDEKGCSQTVTVHGLAARAVQHELDHLNGVLLVDRMSAVQKIAVGGKLKRLRRASREAAT